VSSTGRPGFWKSFNPQFYGWRMLPAAWVVYGLGAVPFYSWGFYLPEMLEELGLGRGTGGLAFGVWTFCGGVTAPLIGICLTRFGPRPVFTAGFLVTSVAYYLTSRSQDRSDVLLYFGLFAGLTHAFSTVLPMQTLAANWFLRYRARAMALLITAAGVIGPFVPIFCAAFLNWGYTWRDGWALVAGLCAALGIFSFLTLRNTPESVGQLRDGARSLTELQAGAGDAETAEEWTAGQAVRTRQFVLMVLCGLGYAVPWGVLTVHARFHIQDVGFDRTAAGWLIFIMISCSTLGRLCGGLADLIPPPRLLGTALALEGTGVALFLFAGDLWTIRVAMVLLGLGFGMAYISQAATFAQFFGRRAFATTTGVRFAIGAPFGAAVPWITGWVFDTQGSYAVPFLAIAAVTLAGSAVAFFLRPPRKSA
jgi:MFS family permease